MNEDDTGEARSEKSARPAPGESWWSWAKERSKPKRIEMDRTPPRRVTGEELQASFTDWAGKKRAERAARTPERKARSARRTTLIGIGALTAGLIALTAAAENGHRVQSAENVERIDALEAEIAEAGVERDEVMTADEVMALADDALLKAKGAASAQQAFSELYRKAATSTGPGDGAPSPEMEAVAAQRKALAPYFAQSAFVVEDEEAYQWSTAVSHESDRIDPRYAWYVRHDGTVPSPGSASTWEAVSAVPVAGEQGMAHATWTCTDTRTGRVLAWASADFDGESGKFVGLEVVTTDLGLEHRNRVVSPGESGLGPEKKESKTPEGGTGGKG